MESPDERNALQIVPEGGRDEEDDGQPVLVPQLWSNYTGPEEPPAEEGWHCLSHFHDWIEQL